MRREFQRLQKMLDDKKLEPFIQSIRFPRYKNLELDMKISFNFPITALVGPNGTNKSSILRALQGCPEGVNIGDFWFSTTLDPIRAIEGDHRFIYSYRLPSGSRAEVRKARTLKTGRGSDYFETSRPSSTDGMKQLPSMENTPTADRQFRGNTRWNPIVKDSVYIDFRQELPAYDIFFHFSWRGTRDNSRAAKKTKIRARAARVNAALSDLRATDIFYGHERIKEPAEELTPTEIQLISRVLGRQYLSIRLVKHDYYEAIGFTARMSTDKLRYTEAFAGSGEFAAIMLVRAICRAPKRSLILLDEPETSLHPAAQRELVRVLAEQCALNHHQAVIATHAPGIVGELPDTAIKLIDFSPATGQVQLFSQAASAKEAFARLGAPPDDTTLFVEDRLAQEFVLRAARTAGKEFLHSFAVRIVPGGEVTIKKRMVPILAEVGKSVSILLDGDAQPTDLKGDLCSTPSLHRAYSRYEPTASAMLPDSALETELIRYGIRRTDLLQDGGLGVTELNLIQRMRHTYDWLSRKMSFFPGNLCPEALLLQMQGELIPLTSQAAKAAWVEKAAKANGLIEGEEVPAELVLGAQRTALARIPDSHPGLQSILQAIQSCLA